MGFSSHLVAEAGEGKGAIRVAVEKPPPIPWLCWPTSPHSPCPISLSLLALVVGAAPGAAPGVALGQGLVREQSSHGALQLVWFAADGVLGGAVVGALPIEADVARWPGDKTKVDKEKEGTPRQSGPANSQGRMLHALWPCATSKAMAREAVRSKGLCRVPMGAGTIPSGIVCLSEGGARAAAASTR